MQKIVVLAIISLLVITGCQTINVEEVPRNDLKVHFYYVVPANESFSQDNANRVWRAVFEMQRWYQTASGGLTFQMLDEENIIEVYFTDNETAFYEDDWWNLLLDEMKEKGQPIQSPGTIAIMWIEGIPQVTATAMALGGNGCDGDCGVALMPVHTLIAQTWPPVDMGIAFHEMGHTFGLTHPIDESDLPLAPEDEPLLFSVMTQSTIRAGTTNTEHGFLTFEKSILLNNPFLKPDVPLFQDFWQTNIINYPLTGSAPEPQINIEMINSSTVSFSTNIDDARLYYWYFGEGSTSNEAAPTHSYNGANWYNVTLMVTDNNYMATRVSKFVQIQ